MPETTFHLPTLRTQEDADAVMFELQDLPCVAQAEVDLATQTAWVAHTAMISPEDILAALAEAGLAARVCDVVEDKKRGLVARLERTGAVDEEAVRHKLGEFTRPWDWA